MAAHVPHLLIVSSGFAAGNSVSDGFPVGNSVSDGFPVGNSVSDGFAVGKQVILLKKYKAFSQ